MTLIPCRECSGQMSTAAKACPHCGHPAAHYAARYKLAGIVIVAGIANFVLAAGAIMVWRLLRS